MTTPENLAHPRTAARWAGAGYLAIFVFAIFANFLAVGSVFDPNDASATAANLVEQETMFRLGMVGFLIIFLVDVVIAWGLFALFRNVRRDVALLAAWFRLTYTIMLGVAIVFLYLALQVASGSGLGPAGGTESQIQLFMQAFTIAWLIGLAAFGLHLILIAALLLFTSRGPRVIAWELAVAGLAYVIDTVAHVMLPDYQQYADAFLALVAIPSIIGELSLTVWLLRVGWGKREVPVCEPVEASAPVEYAHS